jgi:hypothetical protein
LWQFRSRIREADIHHGDVTAGAIRPMLAFARSSRGFSPQHAQAAIKCAAINSGYTRRAAIKASFRVH